MSVKGYYNFDLTVTGEEDGKSVSENRRVQFDMITLIRNGTNPSDRESYARAGTLDLVQEKHPGWTKLTITSCMEV